MNDQLWVLDHIIADCAAIIAVESDGHGTAPIAHCGGWRVSEVVEHLGDVHRWATGIVRTGQPIESGDADLPGGDLVGWFESGAAALVDVLRVADPDAKCWTFDLPPEQSWFWTRRQALEAAVHRFDVESAVGVPSPISSELAVLGIEEVASFLFDRQVALGRTPALDGQVLLEPVGDGRVFSLGSTETAAASISGPSEDLLLMLWGRPHGELIREGDTDLLARFDAAALTP